MFTVHFPTLEVKWALLVVVPQVSGGLIYLLPPPHEWGECGHPTLRSRVAGGSVDFCTSCAPSLRKGLGPTDRLAWCLGGSAEGA